MVKVVAAEVGVAVGRLDFEHAVAKFEHRHVVCAAAAVEDDDFHVLVGLVKTVGQGGCRRFVHYSAHLEAGYLTGFLGCLALCVVEVGGHGDDGFGHFLAQIFFGRLLHLLQNHGRYFLRRVEPAFDVDAWRVVVALDNRVGHAAYLVREAVVAFAHEAFDRVDGLVRVGHGLTLGGVADFAFAVFDKCYDRGGRALAFAVCYHHRFVAFHHGNTRVGRSKVYTYYLSHCVKILFVSIFLFHFPFCRCRRPCFGNHRAKLQNRLKSPLWMTIITKSAFRPFRG